MSAGHPAPADLARIATDIARASGRVALSHFRQPLKIETKADDSPVTRADRETEASIRAAIAQHFPGHAIFGEETGITGDLSGPSWIVDPIDGTRSFISGHPLFGLLLGHLDGDVPRLGLVHMPFLDETFVGLAAKSGHPATATLNGAPISCRQVTRLADAILYINEAERLYAAQPALFSRLCQTGATRRMGYDCYPYALVAAGHVDAVLDVGLEPYDYLPLVALIEAAGGVMTDWQGAALTRASDGRVITAATPALHAKLLALLERAG